MNKVGRPPLRDQLNRVSETLADGLEDGDHNPADPVLVDEVVRESARHFDGVRIRDFVAVLTERDARRTLRSKGLTRRLEHRGITPRDRRTA
jgi:hypothetical protein